MFAVFKLNVVATSTRTFFGGTQANRWDIGTESTYNNMNLWVNGGNEAIIGPPTTNWVVLAVMWNGASTRYAVNTTSVTTSSINPGANTFAGLSVGGPWNGSSVYLQNMDVAEFIWYHGEKTSAQIVAMINYLSAKYAISAVGWPWGVKADDTFESYGTNSELNGLNGGSGFDSNPWVDR
jgi:hypothetical protein